jgi:hypothetical protein
MSSNNRGKLITLFSNKIYCFIQDDMKKYTNIEEEEILNIIEREFDLELLLKYRELRIIEHEIERGKEMKELLEKLILNGNFV